MSRSPIDDNFESETNGDQALEGEPRDAPGGAAGGEDAARLRAERDDLYDRLARTTADFQNTRKRIQAETDQRLQYANQALIKSLLPVIDNFERALAIDPATTDTSAVLRGMQIVHDQWLNVLRQQDVQEIAPKDGEPFDPTRHEALMQIDRPEYRDQPRVAQLLQKGYALHDRTLRPAQVAVSKTS